MEKIITNRKVVINSRTGEESYIEFTNIQEAISTTSEFVHVSMDILKRVDTDHIVVVDGNEETITNSSYTKLETIKDKYEKSQADSLIASKKEGIPEELTGDSEIRDYLRVRVAKDIISNDSANYYGLSSSDLQVVKI